eukprot:TRINITY_DN952_c0_g1_i2.p1 TRINITY_DN952_c0_g1~~TRINITY_DN952_c0_g1_i2.p1  ORF type:complete len:1140 (-),score=148.74 TRINITY_DN952_c0_g1_i2:80-3499(-)
MSYKLHVVPQNLTIWVNNTNGFWTKRRHIMEFYCGLPQWDAIILSEVKLLDNNKLDILKSSYKNLHFNHLEGSPSGSGGILIISRESIQIKNTYKNLIMLFNIKGYDIAATYAPPDKRNIKVLTTLSKWLNSGDYFYIAGDLNGTLNDVDRFPYREGHNNERDLNVRKFLLDEMMTVHPFTGTEYTYFGYGTKSIIDHFVGPLIDYNNVAIHTVPIPCFRDKNNEMKRLSDHVPMRIRINVSPEDLPKKKSQFRFNDFWLEDPNFCNALEDSLINVKSPVLASAITKNLVYNVQAMEITVGREFTTSIAREERKKAKKKDHYRFSQAANKEMSNRMHYDPNDCPSVVPAIYIGDEKITEQSEISFHFKKFFSKLFKKKDDLNSESFDVKDDKFNLPNALDLSNLDQVMSSLSEKTAPGSSGITNKAWKAIFEFNIELFTEYFNELWNGKDLPTQLKEGVMILLKKKNDPRDANEYRGITLLDSFYKIYCKILAKLLEKQMDLKIHHTQFGFIPGRFIQENIVELLMITRNAKGFCLFIDFRKAFDSVDHDYLKHILSKRMCPAWATRLANTLGGKTRIDVNGKLSEPIECESGCRQGDPLSPFLFALAIDPLLRKLDSSLKGIKYNKSVFKQAGYADDLVIFCQDINDLIEAVRILNNFERSSGLAMNRSKTKLFNLENMDISEYEEISDIEQVVKYKYLGLNITMFGVVLMEQWWDSVLQKVLKLKKAQRVSSKLAKARLISSYISSVFVYSLWVTNFTEDMQKRYHTVAKEIIGNVSFDRMTASKHGLNLLHLSDLSRRLKLSWIKTMHLAACRKSPPPWVKAWCYNKRNYIPSWLNHDNIRNNNNAQTNLPEIEDMLKELPSLSWSPNIGQEVYLSTDYNNEGKFRVIKHVDNNEYLLDAGLGVRFKFESCNFFPHNIGTVEGALGFLRKITHCNNIEITQIKAKSFKTELRCKATKGQTKWIDELNILWDKSIDAVQKYKNLPQKWTDKALEALTVNLPVCYRSTRPKDYRMRCQLCNGPIRSGHFIGQCDYHKILGTIIERITDIKVEPDPDNFLGWILTTLLLWRTHVALLHGKGWRNVFSYFGYYTGYTTLLNIEPNEEIVGFLAKLDDIVDKLGTLPIGTDEEELSRLLYI